MTDFPNLTWERAQISFYCDRIPKLELERAQKAFIVTIYPQKYMVLGKNLASIYFSKSTILEG